MSLLAQFERLTDQWAGVFRRHRTQTRATRLALRHLLSLGRRTLSRAMCALGQEQLDWTCCYRFFSHRPWQAQDLFTPVLRAALDWEHGQGPIVVAVDDTMVKKTGPKIAAACYRRDPLSRPSMSIWCAACACRRRWS